MMEYALVFAAQMLSVFALVMGSKLLRDDRWVLAMANSWFISASQFLVMYVFVNATDPMLTFLCAAAGGSVGCGTSHLFYTRYIYKGRLK